MERFIKSKPYTPVENAKAIMPLIIKKLIGIPRRYIFFVPAYSYA